MFFSPSPPSEPPKKQPVVNPVPLSDPNTLQERKLLHPDKSPHETGAVLRMFRAGWTSAQMCKTLGMTQRQLKHEMDMALDLEGEAARLGHPIHDATLPKPAK